MPYVPDNQDQTMQEIEDHLSNGGDLIDLSQLWKIRYSDLLSWVNKDGARQKRFMRALDARGEWIIQALLRELKSMALVDVRQLYDSDGTVLPVDKWPDSVARCVASVEVSEIFDTDEGRRVLVGHTKKIRLWDKHKAVEMLGRDLGRFIPRADVNIKITLEDLITGSIDSPPPPQVEHVPVSVHPPLPVPDMFSEKNSEKILQKNSPEISNAEIIP